MVECVDVCRVKCHFGRTGKVADIMRVLVYLGHPAHFHLFKNVIDELQNRNHTVKILIKKKDVLEDLLQSSGMEYLNILPEGRKDTTLGMFVGMLKRDFRILRYAMFKKIDLMVGTSVELSHVGKLLNIPVLNTNEDDASVVPLYAKLSYPLSTRILSPDTCENGKWEYKTVKYKGYHELAYLHPCNFCPSAEVVEKYFRSDTRFFIIRLASLTAHHDKGIKGIDTDFARRLVNTLTPMGNVYISSERPLEKEFEKYRILIDPMDMHHVLAYASIYIGDSQTMAAEAGVLGTPFIRINDFVGRIGYLRELEEKYKLGYGVLPENKEEVFKILKALMRLKNMKAEFHHRRQKMLADKTDVSHFLTSYIETFIATDDK